MSSFKKALPKRTYRERSQPENRKHLGFLEKKKDYKKRAANANKKKEEIQGLREKAFFKNQNEFYYAMEHTQVKRGRHSVDDDIVPEGVVKKQKLTEGNLLTMKVQNKAKKNEQLKSELHLIDAKPVNTHVIFVKDSKDVKSFDAAKHFDTAPEIVGKKSNRLKNYQLENFEILDTEVPEGYKIFEETLKDEKILSKSLDKNLVQKKMMSGDKYQVIDEDKNVYKWFRERKR